MRQRIIIVSIMVTCFLWTGTFLHDVDQLELSFPWRPVQQTSLAYEHHHHGHSHGHAHGAVKKHIAHSHGSASKELTAVSATEMHGHDPLGLGSGHRDASSEFQKVPVIAPRPAFGTDVVSHNELVAEASRPRAPPKPSKVPIYLYHRAILI